MITIERTVTTDRSPHVVFAYLSDFTNAPQWDAGTVSCVLLSGQGDVGTSYLNTSRFMGRKTQLTYVVREFVPDARYVIQGKNKTVISTDTMTVSATNDGTEVVYQADFEFSGIAKFLEPLLRIPLKKLGDDAEKSLSKALRTL